MTDDRHEAVKLDRFLDGLVQRQGSRLPSPEADLSRFARRIQATAIAPPPDRAYGHALRQSLLAEPEPTSTRHVSPFQLVRRLPRPDLDVPAPRWRSAVEFAAMVLVIVAVFGGIRAGDRLWSVFDTDGDGQFIAADDASPAQAIPAVNPPCETPPRTLADMAALVATPVAAPFDPIADAGGTRPPIEATHGVLHTLEQVNACAAEGDLLALYGNFSDRFVRRHLGPANATDPAAFQEALADPPMVRWPPTVEHISIDRLIQPHGKLVVTREPLLLGDGRVRIGVGDWLPTNDFGRAFTVIFVQHDDRWLVDEIFEADPSGFVVPAVVEGGIAPETITVIETATPATPTN